MRTITTLVLTCFLIGLMPSSVLALDKSKPNAAPPACTLSLSATAQDASCPGANDGSVNLSPSGGTAPYFYGQKLFDYDFTGSLNNSLFNHQNFNVNSTGTELRLTAINNSSWTSQFVTNQSFTRKEGMTFYHRIYIPQSAYKAVMIGFHDGLGNGTVNISHGLYFFNNGGSSSVSIRQGANASSFISSLPANKWYDVKVELHSAGATYSVKETGTANYTYVSTKDLGANPTTLYLGIQATTTSFNVENYTGHKDWLLYDGPNATSNLSAGTYTYYVNDDAGCSAQTTVTIGDNDNTAPTALAQNLSLTLDANGNASATASQINNGSSDNCGAVNLSIDQSTFNCNSANHAMHFDGSQFATVPDNNSLDMGSGDFSFEYWVNVDASLPVSAEYGVLTKTSDYQQTAGWGAELSTHALGSGQYRTVFYISNQPSWGHSRITSSNMNAGTWYHIAGVRSGNTISLYINGVLDVTTTSSYSGSNVDNSHDLLVGGGSWNSNMRGSLDEVRIYNRAISVAEINANMNVSIPSTTSGLVAYYGFNEGPSNSIDDATSNNNDGPLTNMNADQWISSNPILPAGVPVTLTATDLSGNSASALSYVTVIDNTAPNVLTQNYSVNLDASGAASITAGDIDNGSSDECGIASMSVSPSSFSCADIGNNTVILTVTDNSGNVGTATAVVTVIDPTAPTFTIPASLTVNTDPNSCSAIVNYAAPSSSDNCETHTISQTAGLASGSAFPLGITTNEFKFVEHNGNAVVYDFNDLTANQALNGQDNWNVTGNVSTSLATVNNFTASGGYAGGNGLQIASLGGNRRLWATRTNDANFSLPAATSSDIIEVIYDHNRNYWGSYMNFGYDANNDGHISNSEVTFGIFDRNNGSHVEVIGPGLTVITNTTKPDYNWSQWKITIDLSANNGQGSISVAYRDLSGNGAFIAPANLQNLNAGFDLNASNHNNPLNINGMVYSHDAGEATQLDNIRYAVKAQTTQSFTVTVSDNEAPLAVSQNVSLQLDANGMATITANDVNNGSSDNCSIDNIWLTGTQLSFDCDDLGNSFPVTLTVSDAAGNTASSVAMVTIADDINPCNQPPVANCQNVTLYTDASCMANLVTADIDNGSSDPDGDALMYSVLPTGPFAVGSHTVTLTVTDPSGESSSCSATVTVQDSTAPMVTTNDITVYLDATGNASITSGDIDNGSSDACGIASTSLDITSFGCADVGANTVVLSVIDNNGNASTGSATVTVIDSTAPIAATQNITVYLDASGNASIAAGDIDNGSSDACGIASTSLDVTSFSCGDVGSNAVVLTVSDNNGNTSTASATVTVLDTTSPVASAQNITVYLDASGNASITAGDIDNGSSDACGIASTSLDVTSFSCGDVGSNAVVLTVSDDNGNTSTASATVTVLDTTSPVASAQNITVYLDASGNASIAAGDIDNGSSDACGIASVSISENAFNCNNVGSNAVVLTVADNNGNTSTAYATVTVVDTTSPVASAQNITIYLDASGNASITAGDIDNGSADACGIASTSIDVTSFSCGDAGSNAVVLTVADNNGNTSTASATVTVVDTTSPVALAQNITVYLDASGNASITAGDIDNGSADACGIASVSISENAFSCNNVGSNPIVLTVADNNGNTSTASATVTVVDTTSPVVMAQNITIYLDASGNASITAGDIDNGSADACGIASTSLDVTSFSCGDVGSNTVVLTVTDNNGNTSTASATVTVVDTTSPVALAQNITVYLDASGNVSITAADIDNGSADACGIASVSISENAFSCSNVGSNPVVLTVADNNGNVSTASATVTVVDTIAPTMLSQNISIALDNLGNASISVADINAGSSDACGIDSLYLDFTSFGCDQLGDNTVVLTAIDVNGNLASTTATVSVSETDFVEFVDPANMDLSCNTSIGGRYVHWDEPAVGTYSSCSTDTCPAGTSIPGFIYPGTFNGHRYFCSATSNYTWNQANAAAQAAGGHLAVINSSAENHYLACRVQAIYSWIGLSDANVEGQFEWVNGDSLNYSKWSYAEPNNTGGYYCGWGTYGQGADHAVLRRWSGKWYDRRECNQHEFIMEVPCGNDVVVSQIAGPAPGSLFTQGTTTITYTALDTITGATDTTSFDITIGDCTPTYCNASGNNTSYEWIERVKLGGIDNTSGDDGGYADYTNMVAHANTGQKVYFKLFPGFSGSKYKEYWRIFVDWNNDGDFNDYKECVFQGKSKKKISKNFKVPNWAAAGNLRVRVVMKWGGYAGPCSNFTYGEVEDYTLVIDDANGGGISTKNGNPITDNSLNQDGATLSQEIFNLYPNPVLSGGTMNLDIRSDKDENVEILIRSVTGQHVYAQSAELREGLNSIEVKPGNLRSGAYFIQISNSSESLPFVVKN